tara:strand:+ start:432 stop:722 length:291 start_codon:yes stop_codon:yes gene_type:complete
MNVQNVSSMPDYIEQFINYNRDKLFEIYGEGLNRENDGFLYFQCSQENNNVDVLFLGPSKIIEMIGEEPWEQLKSNRGDKKTFFIRESDRIFLLNL